MANVEAINQLRLQIAPNNLKATDPGQYVLKNTQNKTYLQLNEEDKNLFSLFDGTRSVSDILQVCYETKGTLPFKTLYNLISALHEKKFFIIDTPELLDELGSADGQKRKNKFLALATGWYIPVKPFQIFSLLSPVFFIFSLPLIQAILSVAFVAFLFTAPALHRANAFLVDGKYVYGILLTYATFVVQLSLRTLFRVSATRAAGCEVNSIGLRILPGIAFLDANTDDIVMAGRKKAAHVYLSGLMPPILGSVLYVTLWTFMDKLPGAILQIHLVSIVVMYIMASPLYRSDFFCFLDAYFNVPELHRHTHSYFRKKFISRIFSRGAVEERKEKFLIALSTYGFMWLFAGFLMFTSSVADQAYFLIRDFKSVNSLDKIAMVVLATNLILPVLVFLSFFITMVTVNIYHSLHSASRASRLQKKRKTSATGFDETEVMALFEQNPIFAQHTVGERKELVSLVKGHTFKSGETIVAQGEAGDAFYVILEGAVEVVLEDLSGVEKQLDLLSEGDSFGEIALLEHVTRTATVRAIKPTRVLRLEKEHFEHYVADSEEKRKRLTDWIRFYSRLHKSPLFHEMSPGQMLQVMEKVSKQSVLPGDMVIREGDTGDRFYIVLNGKFQVTRQSNGKEQVISSLGEGDYFGDIALLKGVRRTASVAALTDGTLLTLTANDFLDIVRRNLTFGLLLENAAETRLSGIGEKKIQKGKT